MSKSQFYGWKLLAVLWVVLFVNLAFPAYGANVLNRAMALQLHLNGKMRGLPYTVYMLMSGLPGPLVALCVSRLGVRFTLLVGTFTVMAGALIMALFVKSGLGAVVGVGLIIGTGVVTGGALATQECVTRWFVRRRALALSILLSGGGVGGFVSSWLFQEVLNVSHNNWRAGWWVLAALTAVVVVLIAVYVKERPADLGQLPDGGAEPPAESSGAPRRRLGVHITTEVWTSGEVLRSPQLWLMMLAALSVSAGYTLFLAQGQFHLRSLGHSDIEATAALSIATLSTLLAKLIVAFLGDRIEPRYLWAGFTLVFALGMFLIVHAVGPLAIYPFAICLGVGFGGMIVCLMAVLANYYGPKAYAFAVGVALVVQTVGGSLAPYIAGSLYDVYKNYTGSFYFLAVACAAGAVLLLLVRPPTHQPAAQLSWR